jgi:hypothetical protein
MVVALTVFAADTPAQRLAKEAEQAERSGETVRAYLLYAQAAAADRMNSELWAKAEALRPAAEAQSAEKLPHPELETPSTPLNPAWNGIVGSFTAEDLDALERMKSPPRLKPFAGTKDFNLRLEPKALYENVAQVFGYQVIFDKDFNPPSAPVRFVISGADYRDALHALEAATGTFIVPISDNAMIVAQDNTQKRTELENDEAAAIQIPQRTSVQEAQELAMLVQQTMEIRRVVVDPQRRQIMVRDRVSKVEAAQAILNDLRFGKPQVSVEVDLLGTSKSSSLSLGLNLPNTFSLANFGSTAKFFGLGLSSGFIGLGITQATLFAISSRSNATTLLHSTLTASDGQPATFHVGDKYPIQTSGYYATGGAPGIAPGIPGQNGVTDAVISTAPFADLTTSPVSTTGTMQLIVNQLYKYPIVLPTGANNVLGLVAVINSIQNSVSATTIQRGTNAKPHSVAIIANSLGITSIQLIDDPDGQAIAVAKPPDVASAITTQEYQSTSTVSRNGTMKLVVGSDSYPITLTEDKNNLAGLRDAVNAAKANVTASVLNGSTGSFLQIVASNSGTLTIQIYDDPDGANVALLSPTDEVNTSNTQLGNTVPGAVASAGVLGNVSIPAPTFNFEDLGLLLKITPTVHNLEEVSLEIDAEFKVLGAGSYNNVPVISARKYTGKVRLHSGEWAVVAGLISAQDTKTISGIPGLMNLPGLGWAFKDLVKSRDESNILIVLKPRVTSLPATEFTNRTFWIGSETRPLTPL